MILTVLICCEVLNLSGAETRSAVSFAVCVPCSCSLGPQCRNGCVWFMKYWVVGGMLCCHACLTAYFYSLSNNATSFLDKVSKYGETVLLRQTPAGEQSAVLRNQTISEQSTSDKKSLDLKGRSNTFQGTDMKTLQDHDVSSLSKSLDNIQFAATWVSCQTMQQIIPHLNGEEPDGQKSSHKEFHTAVIKALRSDPDLLAEASGITNMVQLCLQSKEQPLYLHHVEILSVDSHLWD